MVAMSAVVSAPDPTVCGSTSFSPVSSRPAASTRLHLGRDVVPSVRMKALMQHFQAAGFSEEVSRLMAAPRGSPDNN